ncbi:hypothetical protein GALL_458470 [mine drainage metagenome]|uniref:Uncharacterized protein n=1 Tax=mine drainage metagenome TaxID=410659 RepID=A0A1J5PP11_9ZZZZ
MSGISAWRDMGDAHPPSARAVLIKTVKGRSSRFALMGEVILELFLSRRGA